MAIYTNGKYLKNQPTVVNPKRKPKKKKKFKDIKQSKKY